MYISTIHKSKEREFDSVYMLLNHCLAATDVEKRKLYVGMTRAKTNLYIHCNTELFSKYNLPGVKHEEDFRSYSIPKETSAQLTHKDVVLDFFKGKQEMILKLHSGAPLTVADGYLTAEIGGRSIRVAKFSRAFREKMDTLSGQGFQPTQASVSFVVAWKGENDEEETAVLLPRIMLER